MPEKPPSLEKILRDLAAYIRCTYGSRVWGTEIVVLLNTQQKMRMPLISGPAVSAEPPQQQTFVPNEMQQAILEALDGKAMRADDLAPAAGYERSTLYRKPLGGLAELEAEGLIAKHARMGYYRPDSPPAELAEGTQR